MSFQISWTVYRNEFKSNWCERGISKIFHSSILHSTQINGNIRYSLVINTKFLKQCCLMFELRNILINIVRSTVFSSSKMTSVSRLLSIMLFDELLIHYCWIRAADRIENYRCFYFISKSRLHFYFENERTICKMFLYVFLSPHKKSGWKIYASSWNIIDEINVFSEG